jgi:hypothetical protein
MIEFRICLVFRVSHLGSRTSGTLKSDFPNSSFRIKILKLPARADASRVGQGIKA